MNARLGLALFAALLVATGFPSRAGALTVDTKSRSAVIAFYRDVYLASERVSAGFTGDVDDCEAGRISSKYREAGLRRILYFRAMAGLDRPVTLSESWNAKCQAAALMMSANRRISHTPARSWECYTEAGAEAASKSNVAYGYETLPAAIDGMMRDRTNPHVGHRRWILFPPQQQMGLGATLDGDRSAFVQWISGGPRDRPTSPEWIAWPSPGYFPNRFVPPGWSFSYPGADFSRAKVRMTRGGTRITVTLNRIEKGFGDNTLVWMPKGLPTEPQPADQKFHVTLSNVRIGGVARSFDYDVIVIDPDPDAHRDSD